jgi:hypothetical protein
VCQFWFCVKWYGWKWIARWKTIWTKNLNRTTICDVWFVAKRSDQLRVWWIQNKIWLDRKMWIVWPNWNYSIGKKWKSRTINKFKFEAKWRSRRLAAKSPKSGRLYSCHLLIFVGKAVHLFAPLSFSSRDLGPMYCNISHQKLIDDQLFVASYQYVSDKGRYDKVENWKTQLLLPVRAKSFIKVNANYSSTCINSLENRDPDGSRFQTPNPSKLNSDFTWLCLFSSYVLKQPLTERIVCYSPVEISPRHLLRRWCYNVE